MTSRPNSFCYQAPASFGLVTYLLHEGMDRARVRKHLLVFCLSAPCAAIATFLLLLSRSVESRVIILKRKSSSPNPVLGQMKNGEVPFLDSGLLVH